MGSSNLITSKDLYNFIATISTNVGIEPYVPHTNTDPRKDSDVSPNDVFNIDLSNMLNSDLIISYIGCPSLGVGAELAISIQNNLPIIGLYMDTDKVSRFALGMLQNYRKATLISYSNRKDLEFKLVNELRRFQPKKRLHLTLDPFHSSCVATEDIIIRPSVRT